MTKPDCFPLPEGWWLRVDDCVDHIGSARYVSKFDLLKGYWQVPLTNRAKESSAFVTPDAFLQYTVMPYGVRNAPATFQRIVNRILYGMSGCEAYLDDVVLYSDFHNTVFLLSNECGPATVWLSTFFKISSFVFSTWKKWIQVWDNMRVSK